MTACPHIMDTELWFDGEAGDQADAIARHIAICPTCKTHVDTVRRLDFAAREAATRLKAPSGLLDRLDDLDAAKPVRTSEPVNRRRLFGGFAAAASIAAIGSVATLRRARSEDLPMAVFGDFSTHLAADRKLDFTETNPQTVMDWFAPKVPFTLPRLASLSEMDLIGGRLCWFLDRRIAVFNFDRGGEALGLYVAEANGLSCLNKALPSATEQPASVSQGGLNGAFWRDASLAHALVGESTPDVIAYFADLMHIDHTSQAG